MAGEHFPVGLLSLRLLTMDFLSQARPLGGLHRASPVPFRASYFTPGLHPPDATAQRLAAYWYRQRRFPLIPSPRFVAHFFGCSKEVAGGVIVVSQRSRVRFQVLTARVPSAHTVCRRPKVGSW